MLSEIKFGLKNIQNTVYLSLPLDHAVSWWSSFSSEKVMWHEWWLQIMNEELHLEQTMIVVDLHVMSLYTYMYQQ